MGVMPERRAWCGDDALRHALVGDRGDIIDAQAVAARRTVEIFTAQLQAARDLAVMVIGVSQRLAALLMLFPIIRIGVALQRAADHRLRLIPFGHPHRLDAACLAPPGVIADEIDEIGAEQQQLGHDRVIVILLRDMAILAGLGFHGALGMRVMRRKGLRREAAGGDWRLLHIDMFAVDVGGG